MVEKIVQNKKLLVPLTRIFRGTIVPEKTVSQDGHGDGLRELWWAQWVYRRGRLRPTGLPV